MLTVLLYVIPCSVLGNYQQFDRTRSSVLRQELLLSVLNSVLANTSGTKSALLMGLYAAQKSQKCEDLICTAAEAGHQAYILVLISLYRTARCHTSKTKSSGNICGVYLLEFGFQYLPGRQLP